jgi:iron-sulfur cluster repair protein YtfE (RIC family)
MTIPASSLTPGTFLSPLDAILLEHDRQRVIADWLLEFANKQQLSPVLKEAEALLAFLTHDLLLHHKDEEDDLFPMLRLRCKPEDQIGGILAELDRDHAAESFLIRDIAVDLRVIVDGTDLESPARFLGSLCVFAEGQRRHLSWENKAVLPLAGKRLTPKDLEALGRNMAARWGIDYPS